MHHKESRSKGIFYIQQTEGKLNGLVTSSVETVSYNIFLKNGRKHETNEMTRKKGKKKMLEFVGRNTGSHHLESSHWKRQWTCCQSECVKKMHVRNPLTSFIVTMELLTCTQGVRLLISITLDPHLPFLKNSAAMGKFGNNIFKRVGILYFRTLVLTCKQIFQSYSTTRNVCR